MFTRRNILTGSAALLAAPSVLRAQTAREVIIVGAGAAGLTAAFHLRRKGVKVRIFEAGSQWGGRVRRLDGFADFPIDVGAEWIHDDPEILGEIVGAGRTDLGVETITYQPQTYKQWYGGRLRQFNLLRFAYAEVKFFNTTWYGFFEKHVVPHLLGAIELNTRVTEIDHSGTKVRVRTGDGRVHTADKVVVTVPVSALQRGDIAIHPDLPVDRRQAVAGINFGKGFKVFLSFRERFYPDMLLTGPLVDQIEDDWDEKLYYDAAFGKQATSNILGLFTSNQRMTPRAQMNDEALVRDVITELDTVYDGAPSRLLTGAYVRNWTADPMYGGIYSMEYDDSRFDTPEEMLAPIGGTLYFAGEALGGDSQSTVQGAAFSAIRAVERMLAG
ncbi:flavin monoamine oxidase family protein [Hoeflea sp. TYP-13]|uniref:flavin monoamine oxidase family protein n=1 Tax=Hoeflea sp. TYP-13 TaxID=3230023 RepID=UPI0034C6DEBC